ncbi:HAD-IIB family hydrolase [Patescibacteria group bacterium]|nr:HAD-IIB family hydrolase [Patescibacteria group bacterium]
MQTKLTKFNKQIHLLSAKKIIVFDMDGTLAKSKSAIDKEMASLLCQLLEKKIVAVMSGANYFQFKKQLLDCLKCSQTQFKNLFIFPVNGGSLYKYQVNSANVTGFLSRPRVKADAKNGRCKWQKVYENTLTAAEKTKIQDAFKKAFCDIHYVPPKKTFGKVIEYRKSQFTFSALGQKAGLAQKKEWNAKADIRPLLKTALKKYLQGFEIWIAGLTSIDITKKGIDKAYGIRQIIKLLSISKKEIMFVGDSLYEGGNDYVVKSAGVDVQEVKGPEQTKVIIRFLLSV